ncbi:MAG: RNA polymerase sigma factor [Acidimicrobiales bacterium]
MNATADTGDDDAQLAPPIQAVPSFEALFVDEYPKMVALAAAVAGSRTHSEDIAQEAMARLDRNWAKVQGYESPGAWLRRITINLATSRRRRASTEARALLKLGAPEVHLEPAEPSDEHVWTIVRQLPKNQRAAVALRYLEDRSIDEIADILEISPSTARVHLHRAKQTLRHRLEKEGL